MVAQPEEHIPANGNDTVEQSVPGPAQEENLEEESLADLLAQATAQYAQKSYRAAAELYSRATELQAEENGEMSIENADLLYLYGRCLYHVAVEKSDVLGSKVAGEEKSQQASKTSNKQSNGNKPSAKEKRVDEEPATTKTATTSKPFFQFTGDENFDVSDDSDSDDDNDNGDGEQDPNGEDEDEFSNAFEILDLARVLLQRKLEHYTSDTTATPEPDSLKQIQERLADTHDLQAEISLEAERFSDAVSDFRAALAIKEALYPPESSYLAELHFKLSLALEFGSVTQEKDADTPEGEGSSKVGTVDEGMREEAAKEMEAAIRSCKLRIEKEEKILASGSGNGNGEDTTSGTTGSKKITQASINDVKEMVADMEQRVSFFSFHFPSHSHILSIFPCPSFVPLFHLFFLISPIL
jgi:HAT1-interacting factor 1